MNHPGLASLSTLLLGLQFTSASLADAGSWKKELAGPLVTIQNGTMVFDELELCTVPAESPEEEPDSWQVRTRSEAAAGKFISRDYFVALSAMISAEVTTQMGDTSCTNLQQTIGRPDLEIRITMTAEGIQTEVANTRTGGIERNTVRWETLFEE